MNRLIASGAVALLVAGGLAVSEPAAAAKKYTACVKKSTGEVRLLLGKSKKSKKCKKGWKKTSWSKRGPAGTKGPDGPPGAANSFGYVVDANGTVIGQSLSSPAYPVPMFPVLINSGRFIYYPNGWLIPFGTTYYGNASCTGASYTLVSDVEARDSIVADPSLRIVARNSEPTLGPAKAFKVDGAPTSVVNLPNWSFNSSGVCTAGLNYTGYRFPLAEVPAPPDYQGPLRLL